MLNIGVLEELKDRGNRKYGGKVALGRRLDGHLYLDQNPRWTESAARDGENKTPRYHVYFMPRGWRGRSRPGWIIPSTSKAGGGRCGRRTY